MSDFSGQTREAACYTTALSALVVVHWEWPDAMAELLDERVPDSGPQPLEELFRLD